MVDQWRSLLKKLFLFVILKTFFLAFGESFLVKTPTVLLVTAVNAKTLSEVQFCFFNIGLLQLCICILCSLMGFS